MDRINRISKIDKVKSQAKYNLDTKIDKAFLFLI